MSVRRRRWPDRQTGPNEAWIVTYTDGKGVRRQKTFTRKREADVFEATARIEVRDGTHVADSVSATVRQAGDFWIASAEANGRERSTVAQYRQHLDLHISPRLGDTLLSKLSVPTVRAFEDALRADGRSPAMVRKVLVSLGSLLADAQERGLVGRNVVREKSRGRHKGRDRRHERRQAGKLKVGVDIPTRDEVKAILAALHGRWRPILITAIFTGMRASELRGLPWNAVDLDRREIRVYQRADRFNAIGPPKSEAGERTLPVSPIVVNALREWKLACPNGELDLVFPNGRGKVESLANLINRGLKPAQVAAGVTVDGKAKYSGMHALRHFFASWLINRPQDGGLGMPLKVVQERMGHASVTLTADVYGHLFPRAADADEMAAAERSLLA